MSLPQDEGLDEAGQFFDIPYRRNVFFTGRRDVLDELYKELNKDAQHLSPQIIAVTGLSGIGKTQIAIEYAYKYKIEYTYIFYFIAERADLIEIEYTSACKSLKITFNTEQNSNGAIFSFKEWLRRTKGWLIIFDSVSDLNTLNEYLPYTGKGHVIITTQLRSTGAINQIRLTELLPDIGAELLLCRAKIALEERTSAILEKAKEISEKVGGHPLALDQAGAYIEEMDITLYEYLLLYEKEGAELRKRRGRVAQNNPAEHPDSVTVTFTLILNQIEKYKTTLDLLRVSAFLAAEPMPLEIFIEGASELGENLDSTKNSRHSLNEAIEVASRFSLIERDRKDYTLIIHKIVQDVIKDTMDESVQRLWAERVLRALNRSFPASEFSNWIFCSRLLSHVLNSIVYINYFKFVFPELGRLLNHTASYLMEWADFSLAEPLCEFSLFIYQETLGEEHLQAATVMNNLAVIYDRKQDFTKSEPLFLSSLRIRREKLDGKHSDVAYSLSNLGMHYYNIQNYIEAENCLSESLQIREEIFENTHLESDHLNIAESLNNLGLVYIHLDKDDEAKQALNRALTIRKSIQDDHHPDIARVISGLGTLYLKNYDYKKAEPYFKEAVERYEAVVGPDHPNLLDSITALFLIYIKQKKFEESEVLINRSIRIIEGVFGPKNYYLAANYKALGDLYSYKEDFNKAEKFYYQSLDLLIKSGKSGTEYAGSVYYHLAGAHLAQRKFASAVPLFKKAIKIIKKNLGDESPKLIEVYEAFAKLLEVKNRFAKAMKYSRKAQELKSKHNLNSIRKWVFLQDPQKSIVQQ